MTRERAIALEAKTCTATPAWLTYGLPVALGCFWAALILQQASTAFGGPIALLRVGTQNPLFDRFASELGPLPTSEPIGHDGQLFYAVARDPLGRWGTPAALAAFDGNGPQYRYRRIFYPLVAGGFGSFSGRQTVFAMMALMVLAMGVSGLALADLAHTWNASLATVIIALGNPAMFMAVWTLEADPVAFALVLSGLALTTRERWTAAAVLFMLAALTKEVYLLVPWSVAAWLYATKQPKKALGIATIATLPLAMWGAFLWLTMPPGQGAQNLGMPLRGLWDAVPIWLASERHAIEWISAALAMALVWRGIGLLRRASALGRFLISPWLLIACTASVDVWGKPNNAARAIAILWPLTIICPVTMTQAEFERTEKKHSKD